MIPELLSCVAPPSIELFDKSVSPSEYQFLSVTDPVIIKRELLWGYYHLGDLLAYLSATGHITGRLVNGFTTDRLGVVVSYSDLFRRTVHRARFVCYLYLQLPEDTLNQEPVQEQRCALDILWFQLDSLLQTYLTYLQSGTPTYWFAGLRLFFRPLTGQVIDLKHRLELDLAHLDPSDSTPSVGQQEEPSIATRTRSHSPQRP
jgi:hypothetical protein